MDIYLQLYINSKQDNWVQLLLIAKSAYKNTKVANIDHISFALNYSYYLGAFYEENVNLVSKSRSADGVATVLYKLMSV